jgi:hypothetical protein
MAAGATYFPIATTTISSSVSTYTFSSIPTTYTDLILIANYGNAAGGNYAVRVGNGSVDTGSNYSRIVVYGTGSSAGSFLESSQTYLNLGNSNTALIANSITQFNNYSNTTTYKSWIDRSNATTGTTVLSNCLWNSTSAINTIQVFSPISSNFLSGTTFTLYGILEA